MALKAQQYQILRARARVLGTSLLIIPELRVLVLTKRHVGSGNEVTLARPGSAPIWGGKKGEFRDWTTVKRVFHCSKFIGNLSLEFLMFHLFAYLAIIIFLSIFSLFKITLLHVSGKFYSSNRLLSGMPEAKKMENIVRLKLPACYMLLMFVYHAADIHGKLKEIHCELSQKKERQKGW